MKIYKLSINEIDSDPVVCVSSYKAPRTTKIVEYYKTLEKAEIRKQLIYDSLHKVLSFMPRVEVLITEITVEE